MQDYEFYDQRIPIKSENDIDWIVRYTELAFLEVVNTEIPKEKNREDEFKNVLGACKQVMSDEFTSLHDSLDEISIFKLFLKLSDVVFGKGPSKEELKKDIMKTTQKLVVLIETYNQLQDVEIADVKLCISEDSGPSCTIPPPPPPAPPVLVTAVPKLVISPSGLPKRLPAKSRDPKQELHDELKKGSRRLRTTSIQRTPSGTPQTLKIPQIVTFHDLAFESLKKKFASQREEH
jgi:hypothetical protein